MRVTMKIPIAQIQMDRFPLNPSTLALIKHYEKGGSVPPIKVSFLKNGNYRIKDGRHRITASKLLGREEILATFSTKCLQV